jgi:hypothetical protein
LCSRGENHAEKCLADAWNTAQEEVAGVDLAVRFLVVRGRNLRQQHDVGQGLGCFVPDERFAAFGDDGVVKLNGF